MYGKDSLGVSPVKINDSGTYDIKAGFAEGRGKISNAMLANVLEYGKSGQDAKPFLAPTKSRAQTFDASAFSVVTIPPETPVATNTIFIYCSSSYGAIGNNYVGLGEVVITAEYPAVIHTVTFLDWDGTLLNSQMVVDGEGAVAPADLNRDGFAFAGWDADFSEVTANMMITATYEIDSDVFDYYEMLGSGHYPSAVHIMDNGFRIFYTKSKFMEICDAVNVCIGRILILHPTHITLSILWDSNDCTVHFPGFSQ